MQHAYEMFFGNTHPQVHANAWPLIHLYDLRRAAQTKMHE
jgi:hypothetical protein